MALGAEAHDDDDLTEQDAVCPSCRTQAIAAATAHMHRLVITFVCRGGAEPPWTCLAREDHQIKALAHGHTQEDALVDVIDQLRRVGIIP